MSSNNPPYVTVTLTKEQFDFLIENCDINIAQALGAMQLLSDRSSLERLIVINEKFKSIRNTLKQTDEEQNG